MIYLTAKSRLSQSSLGICGFPGAKFQHCYHLCQHVILRDDKAKSLVLSFGLNNRSDKFQVTPLPKYRLIVLEAQAAFPPAKIHVVEPNWTESVLDHENITLNTWYKGFAFRNFLSIWSLNWMSLSLKSTWRIHTRSTGLTLLPTTGLSMFWII